MDVTALDAFKPLLQLGFDSTKPGCEERSVLGQNPKISTHTQKARCVGVRKKHWIIKQFNLNPLWYCNLERYKLRDSACCRACARKLDVWVNARGSGVAHYGDWRSVPIRYSSQTHIWMGLISNMSICIRMASQVQIKPLVLLVIASSAIQPCLQCLGCRNR